MWCSGTKTPSKPASSAASAASSVSAHRRPRFAASGGSGGRKSRPNSIWGPSRSERAVEIEDHRLKTPLTAVEDDLGLVAARAPGHGLTVVGDDQAEVRRHLGAAGALLDVTEVGQHVPPLVGLRAQRGAEELQH